MSHTHTTKIYSHHVTYPYYSVYPLYPPHVIYPHYFLISTPCHIPILTHTFKLSHILTLLNTCTPCHNTNSYIHTTSHTHATPYIHTMSDIGISFMCILLHISIPCHIISMSCLIPVIPIPFHISVSCHIFIPCLVPMSGTIATYPLCIYSHPLHTTIPLCIHQCHISTLYIFTPTSYNHTTLLLFMSSNVSFAHVTSPKCAQDVSMAA